MTQSKEVNQASQPCNCDGEGGGILLQVKSLVSLESGGVPTAYLSSQQTQREKRAVFEASSFYPAQLSVYPVQIRATYSSPFAG